MSSTISEDTQKTEVDQYSKDNISFRDENKYSDDPPSKSSSTYTSDEEDEDFDWNQADPEEKNTEEDEVYHDRRFFLCLSRSSSRLSWICYIIATAISIAVCVAVFVTVKPQTDPTMGSYNLALWFTFIAFMFCINFIMQMVIEAIPWIIKKSVGLFTPHRTEVLRARLSVSIHLSEKAIGLLMNSFSCL